MPTKADFLAKLDENGLKTIAKSEGFQVPKTYGKRQLIIYLEGMLTLEKIKKYVAEVYEKETKRVIIKETTKERGIIFKAKETTRIQLNKAELILEIRNSGEKIDKLVLNALANDLGEPLLKGNSPNYDNMNDSMLENIYRIFANKESDGYGKYLEYRFANFVIRKTKLDINNVKIRCEDFRDTGEIDFVGFNEKNQPLLMAECKDRKVKHEDIEKWISNVRKIILNQRVH